MQRDRLLLAEIVASIERILELTAGRGPTEIDSVRDRRDALLWNFTVLGEAVGQISDETKLAHPELDCVAPVRLRNRIVHGYWSIDLDVLTASAQDDLPPFLTAVRAIDLLPPQPPDR
jgi:uncharacterized protein with HEPN domain